MKIITAILFFISFKCLGAAASLSQCNGALEGEWLKRMMFTSHTNAECLYTGSDSKNYNTSGDCARNEIKFNMPFDNVSLMYEFELKLDHPDAFDGYYNIFWQMKPGMDSDGPTYPVFSMWSDGVYIGFTTQRYEYDPVFGTVAEPKVKILYPQRNKDALKIRISIIPTGYIGGSRSGYARVDLWRKNPLHGQFVHKETYRSGVVRIHNKPTAYPGHNDLMFSGIGQYWRYDVPPDGTYQFVSEFSNVRLATQDTGTKQVSWHGLEPYRRLCFGRSEPIL